MQLTPTKLKQLCKECGLIPSKKYGQNFLISDAPIHKMIEAADVRKGDTVIEIGPGFGVLTFELAQRGAHVKAFEIERRLEQYWDERLKDFKITRLDNETGDIEIIWGDVLSLITYHVSRIKNYKVIANLPYQITSHILRVLLELEHKPESITVMVQKEVAERIVAKPGDMSLLSLSVQYYGEPKIVCKVPKGNFWPMPAVDSAVVHILIREQGTGNRDFNQRFFEIARIGFANKRKQLAKNLADGLKRDKLQMESFLKEIIDNEKARAQELNVQQWITLAKKLT
ncbi:MAG: 16S rRNA (adenine(1518)-N(6)/adenine(1519)-N(6))-dimethyltransferase RsmA [Candidatus Magasanikbacteria bacterium]